MRRFFCIMLAIAVMAVALPSYARVEQDEGASNDEETLYEDEQYIGIPGKKSVATAALLSVLPGFGAGLYYVGEYPAAISATVAQATGLALMLDSLIRTHRNSTLVSGITIMGSSWLFGVIYAPISAHQYNKSIERRYGFSPYVGFSDEELYAGVSFTY